MYYLYSLFVFICFFFFSSRRRHTRYIGDWSSDVCSSDLVGPASWSAGATVVAVFGFWTSDSRDKSCRASSTIWASIFLHPTAQPNDMALKDRKSTRLNSSHRCISYAVFCLKKKKKNIKHN